MIHVYTHQMILKVVLGIKKEMTKKQKGVDSYVKR